MPSPVKERQSPAKKTCCVVKATVRESLNSPPKNDVRARLLSL